MKGDNIPATFAWHSDPAYNIHNSLFEKVALGDALIFRRECEWPTAKRSVDLSRVVHHYENAAWTHVVGYLGAVVVHVFFGGGTVKINMAGPTREAALEAEAALRAQLGEDELGGRQVVPFTFWYNTSQGPQSTRRQLDVPRWAEIDSNYAAKTGEQLEVMYASKEPAGGKLFIWHGPPGTGKTYSLRALAWEWRHWVDFHYLVDPETFFGDAPASLMQVALMNEREQPDGSAEVAHRWKMLILEDMGEILAPDAKDHVGQALSRLLNLVDGLIGQGLHLMVLVTTNDELGKLHSAVTRHGRCAMDIKFEPLSGEEAVHWLTLRDVEAKRYGHERIAAELTLADLYALANDWRPSVRREAKVGFALAR